MKIYKQNGTALLMLVIALVLVMSSIVLKIFSSQASRQIVDGTRAIETLKAAKILLLDRLTNPELFSDMSGTRFGQVTILPDMPGFTAHPAYDGLNLPNRACISKDWQNNNNNNALIDPSVGSIGSTNARCFGRFPFKMYGLTINSDASDVAGEIPWMAVSTNLVGFGKPDHLNSFMLSNKYSGTNDDAAIIPRPWLTVRDARGNILSNQVAIVLIYPGRALANQTARTPTAHPNQWLDRVTIKPGCQMPCVSGTYSNFGFNVGNTQSMEFIQAPDSRMIDVNDVNYAQPYQFNDVLVYITADEYFQALEKRAKQYIVGQLKKFKALKGHYSYPATLNSNAGNCDPNLFVGHIAVSPSINSHSGCQTDTFPVYSDWFLKSGWQNYFIYAVDSDCVFGKTCNGIGLTVGSSSGKRALLISPGKSINLAPYALSKNAEQLPLSSNRMDQGCGTSLLSSCLYDYLDSIENTDGNFVFDAAGIPLSNNYNDQIEVIE